ncbi:acetylglutamate kinase [Streptococcus loxodontisalivarius]|uniref:Acetylglutamate kinase n=1 Tax=Streptococcus loxodontisalivarius TaxID=1349415 RepID=A0ABS2PT31_9STRE|nr:acetylglutamate kinase [Streptococcus loxodontisalivarius]MBM7643041.1 acetylglutamate kinase [Streptococcus loxodontisalivarius]
MSETIVIKIGGIASQSLTPEILEQLQSWHKMGHKLLIVHGGGIAISQILEEHGHASQKCDGLRVTNQEDLPLVAEALLNRIGQNLAHELTAAGLDVSQVSLEDLKTVSADFLNKEKYGYVGQVTSLDKSYYDKLLSADKLPLLASLAYTDDGQLLNVNADYLAKALAISLQADQLILMTDVKGVLEDGQVLVQLLTKEIPAKIEAGIITGGMIPKLESAAETVAAGVGQVLIGDNLTTGTVISEV